MKFKLSEKAQIDLLNIGQYTQDQWGIEKRNEYLKIIDNKFHIIAESPNLGRLIDHIRNGYRCYDVEKHVIFYKVKKDHIIFMRILHKSMNISQRLNH